jgi:hypothetical protein
MITDDKFELPGTDKAARRLWLALLDLPDTWHELQAVAGKAGLDSEALGASNRPALAAWELERLGLAFVKQNESPWRIQAGLTHSLAIDWINFHNHWIPTTPAGLIAYGWLTQEARAAVFRALPAWGPDREQSQYWLRISQRLSDWAVGAQLAQQRANDEDFQSDLEQHGPDELDSLLDEHLARFRGQS